ncbi:uncharacterized protein LOC141905014 isoform X1 [Tubulanus polymorphus]|uniref:uncharacterized protein LOC141905014 isoform X1 n=2 Tax=Tubulanus polymorphus TaxID=672921 RepID=UPI003DA3FED3
MEKMESIDLDMDDLFDNNARDIDNDENIQQEATDNVDGAQQDDEDEDGELGSQVMKQLRDMSKGAAKKVIRKPMPKLDADRLTGERGIPVISSIFENVKFKGKGYERDDLNLVMRKMEHWAHRLFPKMPFDEVIERAERLGAKKQVQTVVKKIRLDMPLLDNDFVDNGNNEGGDNEENENEEPVDPFDEILPQEGDAVAAPQTNRAVSDDDDDEFENFLTNMDGSAVNGAEPERRNKVAGASEDQSNSRVVEVDDGINSNDDNVDEPVVSSRKNRVKNVILDESSDSEKESVDSNKLVLRAVSSQDGVVEQAAESMETEMEATGTVNTSLHLHVSASSDEEERIAETNNLETLDPSKPAEKESVETEANLNLHLTESESAETETKLDLHLTESESIETEANLNLHLTESESVETETDSNLHLTESKSSNLCLTETQSIDNSSASVESLSQSLLKPGIDYEIDDKGNKSDIVTDIPNVQNSNVELTDSERVCGIYDSANSDTDLNLKLMSREETPLVTGSQDGISSVNAAAEKQMPTEDEIQQLTQSLTAEDFDDDF